ncbi:hypothetical protein [Cupriavidus sp. WS]|uniref:hypothetical protein n=1 Tax=Cupriavidus sp. WS TaxID=1312922 RepID=UPI0012DC8CE0|nr:hypothetical protein [Cupriavidus sp. WS]
MIHDPIKPIATRYPRQTKTENASLKSKTNGQIPTQDMTSNFEFAFSQTELTNDLESPFISTQTRSHFIQISQLPSHNLDPTKPITHE